MITEDYVSFEVAKLLKEKRFNEYTTMVYNQNGSFMPNGAIEDTYQIFYSAPTLQMAMKWLREEKDCPIEIRWLFDADDQMQYWEFTHHKELGLIPPYKLYESYEKACEAAIRYCLENLV